MDVYFSCLVRIYILDGIEKKWDFRIIAALVIGTAIMLWICEVIQLYCEKVAFSAGNQKLYENLHLKMFERALDLELAGRKV